MLVFLAALLVRLAHNSLLVADYPLYDWPLGGHTIYFDQAKEIYNGNLLPFTGAITLNSPAYPYVLALFYKLFGLENFLALKIGTLFIDSITAYLVFRMAQKHLSNQAAILAGLLYALAGPIIFYSVEFTPIPIVLFLTTLSFYLFNSKVIFSGILLGLACLFRPNLILCALFTPLLLGLKKKNVLFHLSFALIILPITIFNFTRSGDLIPLTASGGHNFYIGHNPEAKAGYFVEAALDGDIFKNFKVLAENETQQKFSDGEVSSYYLHLGLEHILNHPLQELYLLKDRIHLFFSNFEQGNYADYYFVREFSTILNFLPDLRLISVLSLVGLCIAMLKQRKDLFYLLAPILASLLSVALFFYISRLKIIAIPFLCIFAALVVDSRKTKEIALSICLFSIFYYVLINPAFAKIETSNEWNKVGIVYRVQGEHNKARQAFHRVLELDPNNTNAKLNLLTVGKD